MKNISSVIYVNLHRCTLEGYIIGHMDMLTKTGHPYCQVFEFGPTSLGL